MIWLIYVDINQTESLTVDDLLTGTAALSLAIYLVFEHYRGFRMQIWKLEMCVNTFNTQQLMRSKKRSHVDASTL